MTDPMGRIIVELREDDAVSAITSTIRGGEPAFTQASAGAKVIADQPPFVLIRRFPIRRHPRLPIARYQFVILNYGKTPQQAAQLYGAVSDVLHNIGPRLSAQVGIYRSQEDVGGQAQTDPDSKWPFEMMIVAVTASTMAVA